MNSRSRDEGNRYFRGDISVVERERGKRERQRERDGGREEGGGSEETIVFGGLKEA